MGQKDLFCRKVRFLGQNPKIGYQKFNDLQTAKLSKKQLCDRTVARPCPQDSDLPGRALSALSERPFDAAARKAAACIRVSCSSPFETRCQ